MLWRLIKVEVKPPVYHTMAVLLAPCSLCVVSYLNVIQEPNQLLLYFLYMCVLASLVFVVMKLPKFFAFSFTPGFVCGGESRSGQFEETEQVHTVFDRYKGCGPLEHSFSKYFRSDRRRDEAAKY